VVRKRCDTVERGEDGVMSYSNSTLTAQPRVDIRDCVVVSDGGRIQDVPKTASCSTYRSFTCEPRAVLGG
jgi:hypothetical protein